MDPLAHTLVGATLAQTRLKRLSPLAAPTLMIAANLPDIDAVAMFLGADAALYHRRGHTHGILALLILPWILAGLMLLYDRVWRLKRNPTKAPVSPRGALLLSYIGVLSHPFFDWLNNYGVRLLMPFDGRWFYGDTLFIVDPWLWLLMAAAAVLASSYSSISKALWVVLAAATSALIFSTPLVHGLVKVLWTTGVLLIFLLRQRGTVSPHKVATKSLVALVFYLAILFYGNSRAQESTKDWIATQSDSQLIDLMTGPLPAHPLYRQVVAETETHYYGARVHVLTGKIDPTYDPVLKQPLTEPVQKALQDPEVRGFVNWMRFPHFEVKESDSDYEVILRDLRYVTPTQLSPAGIGMVHVQVKKGSDPQ